MAERLARTARRRPRPGSLERPVNARMYRGTWLLVGLPLLVAAFSVARPEALAPPTLPPTFDRDAALGLARDLARTYPDRSPGTEGAIGASRWVSDRLRAYGFTSEAQDFEATIPGRGRVQLRNLVARVVGRSPDVIVVMAHRDDTGEGPGASDNASGTAALIELARAYARAPASGSPGGSVDPAHTIVFLSADGGAFGNLGAERFADDPAYRDRIIAVINLDTIASRAPPRVAFAGERPRSPAPTLVQTAAERILEQSGEEPARPSALQQLVDLGFPFSLFGHAPFVTRGVPAVTLTTGGDGPPSAFDDVPTSLDAVRLEQLGRSAQALLASLDDGLELGPGTASYVYLGPRLIRGWAIQLVLIAALLPFFAAAVDLFARCRRRRIALMPAFRSYRSRLAFWLFVAALFALFALFGVWPGGAARPLAPESAAARDWPALALIMLGWFAVLGWLVARERLLPRRAVSGAEELAGYTASLLVLGILALVVIATNAFALLFLLPSLHAWLWLPQVRERRAAVRLAVLTAGFAGPMLLVATFALRLDLGLDAPWYLATLVAVGYVDVATVLIAVAWLATSAQLAALVVKRYAPYPDKAERPPRGPLREILRRVVLSVRNRRRRVPSAAPEALEA